MTKILPLLLVAAISIASAADKSAVVLKPVLNMYSAASEDTDVVSQSRIGNTVAVVETRDAWLRIRTIEDDYLGWVPANTVRIYAAGEKPYASQGRVAEVSSNYAHLYREASVTKHAPVVTVPFETRLEIAAEPNTENNRWLQAKLPDGRAAWVQRGDLVFSPARISIAETIELAKRFLGLPYTWGGTTSYGYDCSGFAQMLCRRRGILMPRDAGPQCHWSGNGAIEKSQLQPGDLLYFGSSLQKITHTGYYIGDGKFIHATTHDHPMIQISVLADPYWTKLLVATRRPK